MAMTVDDWIKSMPDIVARLNKLERRSFPDLQMNVDLLRSEVSEMQRMQHQSLSLKARRAAAADVEMGNAISSADGACFLETSIVEQSSVVIGPDSAPDEAAASGDIRKKIAEIEARIDRMQTQV